MKAFNFVLAQLHRSHHALLLRNVSLQHLAVREEMIQRQSIFGKFLVRNMAGHSKWQNIRHIKAKNDAIKSTLFSALARQIRSAVISGGPDPKLNNSLAAAIAQARKICMPNSSIESCIKKASNAEIKMSEIELVGPGGCFILLEIESDNINRTVHEVKNLLRKTQLGLISKEKRARHYFESKGIVRVSGKKDGSKWDVESAMDDAILADAEDVQESTDVEGNPILMFVSSVQDFGKMKKWMEESNYVVQDSGLEYVAKNPLDLPEEHLELASQLCSQLEEMNDILKVNVNIR